MNAVAVALMLWVGQWESLDQNKMLVLNPDLSAVWIVQPPGREAYISEIVGTWEPDSLPGRAWLYLGGQTFLMRRQGNILTFNREIYLRLNEQ
jgi:hypothetical protein